MSIKKRIRDYIEKASETQPKLYKKKEKDRKSKGF